MNTSAWRVRFSDSSRLVFTSSRCSNCRACLSHCKAGVFGRSLTTGALEICHPERCDAGCRLCVRICPTGAIALRDEELFISYLHQRLERVQQALTAIATPTEETPATGRKKNPSPIPRQKQRREGGQR